MNSRRALFGLAVFAGLALADPGLAQEPTHEPTLVRVGHLVDPETREVLADRDILVVDGRIAEVGPRGEVVAPLGAEVVDLLDLTALPGLLDAHVHLTSDAGVHGYKRLERGHARAAITGVANARATLEAGFTTVRNLGAPAFTDVALRDAVEAGDVPGPRIIPAGRSIGITGGHCDTNLLPYEYGAVAGGVADGPWAVRAKVRENVKYGAGVIKFCGTGGVLSKGTTIGAQQFTAEEMDAIVDEAHQLGLKVAVHAHGERGIDTAIAAGVDSVEHASFISDAGIQAAIRHGTVLSMDIYVSDYILSEGEAAGILEESLAKERQVGRTQRERFRAAVRAGAKVGYGTDAGVYPHGRNARQMSHMVEWGMSPMDAIRAATVVNAELFGMEGEVGCVRAGCRADMVAVAGDPLKDVGELETVAWVMKGGRAVPLTHR